MSGPTAPGFAKEFLTVAIVAAAALSATPAFAVDPITDSMRPPSGPTAGAPRRAERETKRDLERTPTLTERFGLPPVSGPLPPILPPLRQEPILQDPGYPPPPPRYPARQPRDRDG